MRWRTEEVVALFQGFCEVDSVSPGGDVDTTYVNVKKDGYKLHICGFTPDLSIEIENPDDTEIELVEVTDGMDSAGGCNSYRLQDLEFHARVVYRLKQAGFDVVPTMDVYF
jgi:hypothetical protein